MTTTTTPSLPFRIYQPDRLLETIHIKLPQNQMDYLKLNKEMARPQLHKAFRKKFSSNINKLQFNFNLEIAREEAEREIKSPRKIVPFCKMPDVERVQNVHWLTEQGLWDVRFKKNGKSTSYGKFEAHEHEKAVKAAEKQREKMTKNSA